MVETEASGRYTARDVAGAAPVCLDGANATNYQTSSCRETKQTLAKDTQLDLELPK